MKENKFLFYGCVIVTVICAMWMHFHMMPELEFVYQPEVYDETESVDVSEFFVDIDDSTDDSKDVQENDVVDGIFTGCSARFKSQIWARDLDGESTERYYSTNTITCKCMYGDNIIEKTETYEYSSEPTKVELDCNKKCAEICAK